MIDCVSVQNMRLSDRQTIEKGTSGRELIRRAAFCVFRAVAWSGKVAVVCGSGNNGADGFALASILLSKGIDVTVFQVSDRLHDDCAYFALEAKKSSVPIVLFRSGNDMLRGYDIIVDCMLGTGFQGELRTHYRYAIKEINEAAAYVVSVDINSGMNGDTGKGSAIVRSDLTVAIEFIKTGMIFESSEQYIKRLICAKIGIDLAERESVICDKSEWESICRRLQISSDSYYVECDGIRYLKCPKWMDMSACEFFF